MKGITYSTATQNYLSIKFMMKFTPLIKLDLIHEIIPINVDDFNRNCKSGNKF